MRLLKWIGVSVVVLIVLNLACAHLVVPVIEGRKARRALQMEMRSTLAEVGAPGNADKVKRLLDRGADIHTRGYGGTTVAMVAAWWDDAELMRRALDAGADPNAADTHGNTALIAATFGPGDQTTRLLLTAGADPKLAKAGDTPLMWAVRNARHDLIPLLMAAGADVNAVNGEGETAVSLAQQLRPGVGPRPMRPDLTADDFVRLLAGESK